MAKNENKTHVTEASVDDYLSGIDDEKKREEAFAIKALLERVSGEPAKMWGASLIGCGQYHYKYDTGRVGTFMRIGFAPRKANLVVYLINGFEKFKDELDRLGKHKIGKSCLYINRLSDIDESVLEELAQKSIQDMAQKYPE